MNCLAIAQLSINFTQGTAVILLCTQIQNDWTTEKDVMDERIVARFELTMNFGRVLYIAQQLWPQTIYEPITKISWVFF